MKRIALITTTLAIITGCGNKPECHNRNAILDMNGYTTPQYKTELLHQINIAGQDNVTYWIEDYQEIGGKPFMLVEVQADSICGRMLIDIKNPNKVADFKNVKGISYRGDKINGLQYFVDTANGKFNFIWQEGVIVD